MLAQAKKSYQSQKRAFPKAGTEEYQTLKNQAVAFLVQRVEFDQKAKDLGLEVTDKQVDERLARSRSSTSAGDEKKYAKQLADQGLTEKQVRADLRAQLVSEGLFKEVTKDVKVTDKDVSGYYDENKATYSQQESRDVRHILVKTKALADDIYGQLARRRRLRGAREEVLGRSGLEGPGRQAHGRPRPDGRRVRPDRVPLKTGTISRRSRRSTATTSSSRSPRSSRAKQTPLKDVKESIRQQLLQTKRNEAMTEVGGRRQAGVRGQGALRGRLPAASPAAVGDRDLHRLARVAAEALLELQELTERLRRDCPWDREQTARTIVPHTVEEAYEVADAALAGDTAKLLDELGDLLFQVYFLAAPAREQRHGDLEAVARGVHEKLVRRHPHVFGDAEAQTAGACARSWERIKRDQEGARGHLPRRARGAAGAAPGAQGAAARRGGRVRLARPRGPAREGARGARRARGGAPACRPAEARERARRRASAELGDVLFAVVNVARRLNVDPELALRGTTRRFVERVERAEATRGRAGEDWRELPLDEQDRYFDQAKEQLG